MKRSYRHNNPKLRYSTICKIARLERKIEALVVADEAMYDAGYHRLTRGLARAVSDKRVATFKLRAAEKKAAAPPPPGSYPSDGPNVPANWRNQPVGGSFVCIWKPDRCSTYFNPAYWGVSIDPDGSTRVTRIAEDASHPAGPDASSLGDDAAMTP